MLKIIGIYQIRHLESGKCYIGSSNNILERFKQHVRSLKKQKHVNNKLQYAWNKYGVDAFEFEILAETTQEHVEQIEQLLSSALP